MSMNPPQKKKKFLVVMCILHTDAWSSVAQQHVLLNNAECLHANCLQMIQRKQWPPNSPNLTP